MTGPGELAAASAIVALGALVQGAVGFGLALVAAPLVTLIDPRLVPGPMLLTGLVLPLLTGWRERRTIDLTGTGWALLGRVPGAALGAALLALLSEDATALAVGVIVLAGVALTVSGLRLAPRPPTLVAAGVLSGFMGTTSSVGGPPIALVYQDAEGPRLRGTLSAYFAAAAAISIAALALAGRFGRAELVAGLALVPGVVLGFLLSGPLARFLDGGYTRLAVLGVSTLAALALVVRHLG